MMFSTRTISLTLLLSGLTLSCKEGSTVSPADTDTTRAVDSSSTSAPPGTDSAAGPDTGEGIESDPAIEGESDSAPQTGTDTSGDTAAGSEDDTALDTTGSDADADTETEEERDTVGFDNRTPVYPEVTGDGGVGNVTTYGNLVTPEPSRGGACNYGSTGVLSFAAINVNVAPGDGAGHWDSGRICGQCAAVTAETPKGLVTTVVRIMDKCPDDHCGIDLGGLPAQVIMGTQAGRYDGAWTFVPCEGQADVSDGPAALFVKEGSSEWWAIVQVRNPPARVIAIRYETDASRGDFEYATEAENFFSVPEAVRTSPADVTLTIEYDFGLSDEITVTALDLTTENALLPI